MARKHLLAAAAALAALTTANAVSAAVYTYTESTGDVLTINTTSGTGTLVGPTGNVSFSGNFSSFTGGATPNLSGMNITITPTSYLNYGNQYNTNTYIAPQTGVKYTLIAPTSTHPDMLTITNGSVMLWAEWQGNNGIILGDQTSTTTGYTPPSTTSGGTTTGGTTTGGTTTGGTTTGGTTTGGTTTGGTAVPEPTSEFALFGLGLVAILIGRRDIMRRKAKA